MYEACRNPSPLYPVICALAALQSYVTDHYQIHGTPQLLIQFPKMSAPIFSRHGDLLPRFQTQNICKSQCRP